MHAIRSPQSKAYLQYKRNYRNSTYTWKMNNSLLNDNFVKEEIKKLKTLEINENEGTP